MTANHRIRRGEALMADGTLATEASTCDLRPGDWPAHLDVVDDHDGSVETFDRDAEPFYGLADDAVGGFYYRGRTSGARLTVFND